MEGRDFLISQGREINPTQGGDRKSLDYHLTLDECGFVEGRDYLVLTHENIGIAEKIDYHLTLDVAKHFAASSD